MVVGGGVVVGGVVTGTWVVGVGAGAHVVVVARLAVCHVAGTA